MSTAGDNNKKDDIPNICANCGKGEEGANSLKACTACKLVKYCNRECQIAHRSQHKKECKKRAAELHEEALFKQPPPKEDCPICFVHMPYLSMGRRYYTCCGKEICNGCAYAPVYDDQGNIITEETCPFCRTPACISDAEEIVNREKIRMENGDANAIYRFGNFYRDGINGFPQDMGKALEFYKRAGELGHSESYNNVGSFYYNGGIVILSMKKAKHYLELAAIGGSADARHNLGIIEGRAYHYDRALKHYMIVQ